MAPLDDGDKLAQTVRTAQIITFGLVTGVASFLAITVFSVRAGKPFAADPWDLQGTLTSLALISAAIALVVHRPICEAAARKKLPTLARWKTVTVTDPHGLPLEARQGELPALLGLYVSGKIIGLAILEWAAFLAAIAYLIEGSAAALIASFTLGGVILLSLPTRSRVEGWVERRQSRLDETRQFGG